MSRPKKALTNDYIAAMTETYDKEQAARLSAYQQRLDSPESSTLKSRQFEVYKKKLQQGAPKPGLAMQKVKDTPEMRFNKKKPKQLLINIDMGEQETNKSLCDTMTYVKPEVKEILYDGLSCEQKGRWRYLKKRTEPGPDEKYYFPICLSWEYGWKNKDNSNSKPEFARTRLVNDTFYSRSGIPGLKISSAF